LEKLKSKLRVRDSLPKLPLRDLEQQYANRKTPEYLKKAILSSDNLVKQCKKELE